MATTSNIVNTLGAGSGIDTKALAQNLVEAERAPLKQRIDDKITKDQAKISGYGALKYALSTLQTAFAKLNDSSDFSSLKPANTQATAFGVTAGPRAAAGSYNIAIDRVAQAQRNTIAFDKTTPLNGGTAFSVKVGPTYVDVTNTTPAGLVSAINGAKASTGITAQLVNTGAQYTVVITGKTGLANAFDLQAVNLEDHDTVLEDIDFGLPKQNAIDAQFSVNGVTINRPTNTINDVLDGITFDLYAPTTGGARLDLNRETTAIKDNLKSLVSAYNDFEEAVSVLGDAASKVEGFGGSLKGENIIQTLRSQVRNMVTASFTFYANPADPTKPPASDPSAAALNPNVNAGRHIGLSFDKLGKLNLNEAKLDNALSDHFDQVVTMMTAGTNGESVYSARTTLGLAGNAVRSIDKMLRVTGPIERQTQAANKDITAQNKALADLEDRMTQLLARYTAQFSAMDAIVGQSNSLRTSLKGSFESMMNSSKN